MDIAILSTVRLFGDALATHLSGRSEISVVAVAQTFSGLCNALAESSAQLALIDVTQGIAIESVRELAAQWPSIALLALGLRTAQDDVVHCGRAGFSGFVPRDADLDQLVGAMQDALAGKLRCTDEVACGLFRALGRKDPADDARTPSDSLTNRERDVLRELGNGYSNKEIARELGMSLSTVKHHVHKILEKLEVVRRAEAVRKAHSALPNEPSPTPGERIRVLSRR